MIRKRGGFTLVEVMVSGALLVLLSLLVVQGFSVCGRLEMRSSRFRAAEEKLEARIVREGRPSRMEHVTLKVGDGIIWDADIYVYELHSGDARVSFKVLRNKGHEK